MSDLTRLNPTPHAIAVYASQPLSPVSTQHSLPIRTLPFTWAGLSPAGSHQLCLAHSFNHLIAPSITQARHDPLLHLRLLVPGAAIGHRGGAEHGAIELDFVQVGAAQIGSGQYRARQVGAAKIGAERIGIAEIGADQTGVDQLRPRQARLTQRGTVELRA